MVGAGPHGFFEEGHGFRTAGGQPAGQGLNGGVEFDEVGEDIYVKTFLLCPDSIPPLGGIDSQIGKGRQTHLAFNGRPYHEWSDADGQFAEFHGCGIHRQAVINRRSHAT